MLTLDEFKDAVTAQCLRVRWTFEDYSTNEDICHVATAFVDDTYLTIIHQDSPKPWRARMNVALYNGDADELFGYGHTLSECLGRLMAEVNRARSCYNDAMEVLT